MTNIDKDDKKISKEILNIIRTTMRNNIVMTNIADNKANVLLSVNALMLAFLIPLILRQISLITEYHLYIPLFILVCSCLVTIYLASLVLKPSKFFEKQKELKEGKYISPFFFGNYYKMNREEFRAYIDTAIYDKAQLKNHITEDLHYVGIRLGHKLTLIRKAFNIFFIGLFGSIILSLLCFLIKIV